MSPLAIIAAIALSVHRAPVPITVDIQPGQVLSGVVTIHVSVGKVPGYVEQVELYINGDLNQTETSIPYTFRLNTLDLDDGDASFDFQVSTTVGDRGDASVTVKIDNGVSKGIDFNVKKAQDLLSNGDFANAEIAGRIAMKAALKKQDDGADFDEKRDLNPVRVVLARANEGLQLYDRAQKFIEDALAADPDNHDLQLLSAGIDLKAALNLSLPNTSAQELLQHESQAMNDAIGEYVKLAQAKLDAFGPVTPANTDAYLDVSLSAGRYSLSVSAAADAMHLNPTRLHLINRVAYTQLMAQRYDAARQTISSISRFAQMDGYSYAILALLDSMTGEQSTVDEDLRNAALSGNVSQGVETAQAFLALKTGNYGTMGQLLNDIRTRFPDCTETSALTFCYLLHLNHLADANTAFQDAILRNPISVDAYLLQARVALSQAQQRGPDYRFRLEQAAAFYGMAEAAMPESAEAWTGTALVDSMAGDQKQAVYAIQAAIGGSKSYAASQYVAQYIYHTKSLQEPLSKLRQAAERAKTSDDPADYQDALKALQQATGDALNESAAARDAAKAAASIDPRHLAGISYPSLDTVLKYFIQNGASPIITPPSPGE